MGLPQNLKDQLREKFTGRVRFDAPMAAHTGFRVGGPADAFVEAADAGEIAYLIRFAAEHGLPYLVVGRGSNLLVKDAGIRGIVISMTGPLTGMEQRGYTEISAMAGAGLGALCRFAVSRGLGGLNFAMGIPGSVGGAIRGNAGAWGRSMADVLKSIRIIRPDAAPDATMVWIDREQMVFSYRAFGFSPETGLEASACVILEGLFTLTPQDPEILKKEAEALFAARKEAQPVGQASAGCFFKNPPSGDPAGRLLDLAGCKGLAVGDAMVSTLHANYIVNRGRATARDILLLKERVQEEVLKKFNILLEPEVQIVGD